MRPFKVLFFIPAIVFYGVFVASQSLHLLYKWHLQVSCLHDFIFMQSGRKFHILQVKFNQLLKQQNKTAKQMFRSTQFL